MNRLPKNLEIIIEETKTGFSAYSTQYAISTVGKTIADLINNANEAVAFYFEEFDT